jgi:Tfp pilus assembly PilM family ATPase
MPRHATGIDVSTAGSAFVRGFARGNTFVVTHFALFDEPAADIDSAWQAAEPGFTLDRACIAVTGRDVNLRYSRVPRLPDWQLEKLMRFEIAGVGDSSDSEVAGDFNVLPEMPELEGEDVVLLALAKEGLLGAHLEGLKGLKGRLAHFSPASIALYNAWLRFGVVLDDTVLLASLGRNDIDLVIARGADLVFARNLGGGTELFEKALMDGLGLDQATARDWLTRVDLTPGARFTDARVERASQVALSAAGQLASLLQSSLVFAKSQIKLSQLQLDRLFLCGPGAEIRGLAAYLARAVSAPTEVFDPFLVVELGKLDPEARTALEAHKARAVVALGLATGGSWERAYSIEILPESAKKRREFLGGTLFMILAGVLLLGSLVLTYQRRSEQLKVVQQDVARLKRDLRAAESADAETRALIEANETRAEVVEELERLALSGEVAARALEALDRRLPFGFWLTRLSLDQAADGDFGFAKEERVPILAVEGQASEGVEPNAAVFQRMVEGLRGDLPEMRLREGLSPDGSRFTLRMTLVGSELVTAAEAADVGSNPAPAQR